VYTVLVIDDSEHVRNFLSDLLSDNGYKVREAASGEKGLEQFAEEKPDCVLLDVILPKIDGLEVLKRIRESDSVTPILMMTAEDPGWVRMSCEKFGANGFLSKVFDPENILEAVENAILDAET